MSTENLSFGTAILAAFRHLLSTHPEVFVVGQGLWSPWYVGTTMKDLDKDFGIERVIDSPVSELATTGVGVGAALCGYRPIVVHPRMDFMVLAIDQIVSQAAKWSHMFGGQAKAPITVRGIINRGGEQGAQHSQALHSWFAHVPGLRVVMPATPADAHDLLVASVMCDDPVMYIDDRWLYEIEEVIEPRYNLDLRNEGPKIIREGNDYTLVGCGHTTQLCLQAADTLAADGLECDVVDLRILNPLRYEQIVESVQRTGRLCVVDGGWSNCGMAGEIIAGIVERLEPSIFKTSPVRITLPDAPAPTSKALEDIYYIQTTHITEAVTRHSK